MNFVLGGHNSPVINVRGDNIHQCKMSGGTYCEGTVFTMTTVRSYSSAHYNRNPAFLRSLDAGTRQMATKVFKDDHKEQNSVETLTGMILAK